MHRAPRLCFLVFLCSAAGVSAAAQQAADAGSSYTVTVQPKGSKKAAKQMVSPMPAQTKMLQPTGNLPRPSQLPQASPQGSLGNQRLPLPQQGSQLPQTAPAQMPAYGQPSAQAPSYPQQPAYGQPRSGAGGGAAVGGFAPTLQQPVSSFAPVAGSSGSSVTVMVMPKGYKGKVPKAAPMPPIAGDPLTGPQGIPVAKAPRGKAAAAQAYAESAPSGVRGAMVAPPVSAYGVTGAGGAVAAASAFPDVPSYTGTPTSNAPLPKLDTRPMVLAKKPVPKKVAPVVRATRTRELPEGYEPNPPDEAMLKRERLRWDGEYELDRLERPQLDSAGKVIPVLYERNGKAVRPKGVRLAKLHPATIQNGVLTVDGWTSKGRLNYAVQDLKFLYFSVPGVGTVIVSPESFGGAEEQADAFNGTTLKVTAGDHEVQLVTEKPILTKNSLPAYVKVDASYIHDRKAPVMGYGGFESAPYLWPGAVAGQAMQGSLDAPELPKNMMPAMAGHLCDSRTGQNCEPVSSVVSGKTRPAWAVDPDAPAADVGKPGDLKAPAAAPIDPTKPAVAPSRIVEEPLSGR